MHVQLLESNISHTFIKANIGLSVFEQNKSVTSKMIKKRGKNWLCEQYIGQFKKKQNQQHIIIHMLCN